jgi:hypothetical protein
VRRRFLQVQLFSLGLLSLRRLPWSDSLGWVVCQR